ncbi:hypothetical protein E2C01_077220 [Portunus trituberculatus]|uniref:Uncharacterized protein n=1 Tax=Portunus trituberculatus TaxID=210409 RepID=A0A5B7IP70_PORTR|nr:hypothetical protein [Portunus trituberculatus]
MDGRSSGPQLGVVQKCFTIQSEARERTETLVAVMQISAPHHAARSPPAPQPQCPSVLYGEVEALWCWSLL